ncbi:MAG: AEC family transporter, partial [Prochlorotrichaceae cyanobacterium]
NSPPLEGCPEGAGWFSVPLRGLPPRQAMPATPPREGNFKRSLFPSIPLLWRGAPKGRGGSAFHDEVNHPVRLRLPPLHGRGILNDRSPLINSPPLEGCPAGAGWFSCPLSNLPEVRDNEWNDAALPYFIALGSGKVDCADHPHSFNRSMLTLLSSVLPAMAIVFVGAIAERSLQLDIRTLSRLILYILSPALITDVLYRTELSGQSALALTIGFTLIYLTLWGVGWGLGRLLKLPPATCTSLIATTTFPNTGNMGLSVSLFALGDLGLERATIVLLVSAVLVFSTGPALLRGEGWRSGLLLTLRLPLIWAVLLGLSLRLLVSQWGAGVGTALPLDLDRGIHLLAQATIPVALLTLGMQISRCPIRCSGYTLGASVLRLLGGCAIATAITVLLGIHGLDQKILILQCSMPAAVTSFVMANEVGGDGTRTGQVVALSTLFSFVSLPLILWGLGQS